MTFERCEFEPAQRLVWAAVPRATTAAALFLVSFVALGLFVGQCQWFGPPPVCASGEHVGREDAANAGRCRVAAELRSAVTRAVRQGDLHSAGELSEQAVQR